MSLTKTDLRAIEAIVDKSIVTKVKPMIDELVQSTAAGFNEMDKRFDEVDRRFIAVDKRFEEVDKRFDEVDKRFEEVDKRFDEVDKRFDKVDERLEALELETSHLNGNVAGLRVRFDNQERRISRQETKSA